MLPVAVQQRASNLVGRLEVGGAAYTAKTGFAAIPTDGFAGQQGRQHAVIGSALLENRLTQLLEFLVEFNRVLFGQQWLTGLGSEQGGGGAGSAGQRLARCGQGIGLMLQERGFDVLQLGVQQFKQRCSVGHAKFINDQRRDAVNISRALEINLSAMASALMAKLPLAMADFMASTLPVSTTSPLVPFTD